ncbi:hypothetical protein FB440_12817 [Vibrio crassostreae]|uniref:hypothetical protein n=1 Tax=Vibrio crassostreae TaxID=246167 RepID=UPI000F497638|nr:hypothetical protein [Vibrio crassostreae]NOI52540.1 hypothetical protein [Vibrio crassostreae]ROR08997.1 hypothetical protein EDB36_11441 [Vibrio crassostreae]TCN76170.1 hypothetical protein EDB62_11061 [Vibrio crassostreae]TWD31589.1 hypothetical protein FB440_12817 [Vibrio crassostreae]TWD72303.1 hypothetical protein FB445_103245 [Vibrio crassostreae]
MNYFTRLLFALLTASTISFYTNAETHTFQLTSDIDKKHFFSYQITEVAFSPSSLTLRVDPETDSFRDATTQLLVETDVPSSDQSTRFQLFMTSNTAQCFDIDKQALSTPADLVDVTVADQPLTPSNPVLMDFNTTSDNLKGGEYDVTLSFGALPTGSNLCQGQLSVLAELSL